MPRDRWTNQLNRAVREKMWRGDNPQIKPGYSDIADKAQNTAVFQFNLNLAGSGERSTTFTFMETDSPVTMSKTIGKMYEMSNTGKEQLAKALFAAFEKASDKKQRCHEFDISTETRVPINSTLFYFNMKYSDGDIRTADVPVIRGATATDVLGQIDSKFVLNEQERSKLIAEIIMATAKTEDRDVSSETPKLCFDVTVFDGLPRGLLNFLDI